LNIPPEKHLFYNINNKRSVKNTRGIIIRQGGEAMKKAMYGIMGAAALVLLMGAASYGAAAYEANADSQGQPVCTEEKDNSKDNMANERAHIEEADRLPDTLNQ
jgi:hypothetical protein